MRSILGKPMLLHQIERVLRSRLVDKLVVATSTEAEDEEIRTLAERAGVPSYQGSLDDVLDRFYRAAKPMRPQHVVRLTGDCPFADWQVIDKVLEFAIEGGYDYASNTIEPTWPDGLDVEVMTFAALEGAWKGGQGAFDREHVTPYIYRSPARFKLGNCRNEVDLSDRRWTVDEPADFDFTTAVYEALYPEKPDFLTRDILDYLTAHPEVAAINASFKRNEGSKFL